MRKADVVDNIATKTGISKVDILLTVEAFLKEIKENIEKGQSVYLRGFGTFTQKKRAAKKGRIVRQSIEIDIPEHFIPFFKPAKEFLDSIKKMSVTTLSTILKEDSTQ